MGQHRETLAGLALLAGIWLLAVSCDEVDDTPPPKPHIIAPATGIVRIPVKFVVTFDSTPPPNTFTLWSWGDRIASEQSWDSVVWHAYGDTGTYVVKVGAHRIVHYGFLNQYERYISSGVPDSCTVRIVRSGPLGDASGLAE